MNKELYSEKPQVSLDIFIQRMYLLNRANNPELVAKIIIKWTQGQSLLTKKLLQYVLQSEDRINEGEEAIFVEKVIRNCLLTEFKHDDLTLIIREELYAKDLNNLLEINNGELKERDRLYLVKLQTSLGLTEKQAQKVHNKLGVNNYLALSKTNYIDNRINNSIALEGKDINKYSALANISLKNSTIKKYNYGSSKEKWLWLLLSIPLLFLLFKGINWYRQYQTKSANNSQSEQHKLCVDLNSRKSPRMSLGEKILTKEYGELKPESTIASYQGMAAFARCEFSTAHKKYQESIAIDKNNPEALIYSNNAAAIAKEHFKIAVSIPLGSEPDIAWEILRGVAQAQTEINQQGGIKNKPLLVQIIDDDNDPQIVKQLAKQLSADQNILAVVGHNDSNSSIAGAKIYQREKLVMISPTSTSNKLSGIGSHIMRTIPSVSALANKLANYASVNSLKKIAICSNSQDSGSVSFTQEFIDRTTKNGGQIQEVNCDFAKADFQPDSIVSQAIAENVDALLLAPSVNKMEQAIAIAQANQQQLPLLGNHSLYTYQTIESGQDAIAGMVIPSPWLSDETQDSQFPAAAIRYWGGQVNWRTAMAYDATGAIIQGLQMSNNRSDLQSVLTQDNFSVDGATGQFHFQQGDRFGQVQLAYIKKSSTSERYQFSKLKL